MNEVTRIIHAIEQGDGGAAEKLLPAVYEELRLLAARKMAQEKPGQTLQATALVHEAYIRLIGSTIRAGTIEDTSSWLRQRLCGAYLLKTHAARIAISTGAGATE